MPDTTMRPPPPPRTGEEIEVGQGAELELFEIVTNSDDRRPLSDFARTRSLDDASGSLMPLAKINLHGTKKESILIPYLLFPLTIGILIGIVGALIYLFATRSISTETTIIERRQ